MILGAGFTFLFLISTLSLISHGIPLEICDKIVSFFPKILHPSISKIANGFHYDVSNKNMPSEVFLVIFTAMFFVYSLAIYKTHQMPQKKNLFFFIIMMGIFFRLVLIPSVLIHENDIYRYIWDGKVLLLKVNPYKYAPNEANLILADSEFKKSKELKKINTLIDESPTFFERIGYKDIPTIYPPFAEAIFAISNILKRNSIVFLKLILIFFDIGTIFFIIEILKHFKLNKNMVIVYAWSPLVLKEFANSGHLDSLVIFFLMGTLLFFFKNKTLFAGIFFSFSILSKYFPIILIPLFLKKRKWKLLFISLIVTVLPILFFILWNDIGFVQYFKGFTTYSKNWAINGGVFEFIYSLLMLITQKYAYYASKIIVALLFMTILGYLSFQRKNNSDIDLLKKIFFIVLWLFLLSPVGDPWYFCWVIPFLCFFPCISVIFLSWLLIFSYLFFTQSLGTYTIYNFTFEKIILIQYVPFYIFFLWETLIRSKGRITSC